jgi:hypothetical protein
MTQGITGPSRGSAKIFLLASGVGSFITGEIIRVDGGEMI